MKELSKSIIRRQRDPNFVTRYFKGSGIDIGGFPDPLSLYTELFPLIKNVQIWDLQDGDAQFMQGVADNLFDFVVSSHCLEHLKNPSEGLANWFRIVKPGGFLIVTIPEEDLYEQGTWPSNKNLDHKFSFTIWKQNSWAPNSLNVIDLLKSLGNQADIRSIRIEDTGYRFNMPIYDQTLTPIAESAIEFIVRKKLQKDLSLDQNLSAEHSKLNDQLLPYFNQYIDDIVDLKRANKSGIGPFKNNNPI